MNQNAMFFCHLLNNIGFLMKRESLYCKIKFVYAIQNPRLCKQQQITALNLSGTTLKISGLVISEL
jgi:hypothetical protein